MTSKLGGVRFRINSDKLGFASDENKIRLTYYYYLRFLKDIVDWRRLYSSKKVTSAELQPSD